MFSIKITLVISYFSLYEFILASNLYSEYIFGRCITIGLMRILSISLFFVVITIYVTLVFSFKSPICKYKNIGILLKKTIMTY